MSDKRRKAIAVIVEMVILIGLFALMVLSNVEAKPTPISEPVPLPKSEQVSISKPIPEIEPITEIETESLTETAPENDYIFYDVPFDLDTQKEIIKICSEYDISYELILGVISVESSFRPEVVGDGGNSFGLMQIQPKWWSETIKREGVTNLLDPLQNIRCGCAILRELKNKYVTEYRALQAYNTGRPNTNNGYAERVYRHIGEFTIYGG